MTARPELRVTDDARSLAREAADLVRAIAREAVSEKGAFTLALSGGSTPAALYDALAADPQGVAWPCAQLFWSDERCVPPTHPDSNYRLAFQRLLTRVPVQRGRIHRMHGELPPEAGARRYEETLREALQAAPGEVPGLDLLLLGLGADGHVASLFPGSAALTEERRLAAATLAPDRAGWRISLTPPVLRCAARVLVLVSGERKACALAAALAPGDVHSLPARLLHAAAGRVVWLADRAAASALEDG